MGLFSFIKNTGAQIFGIGKTEEEEALTAEAEKTKRESEAAQKLEGMAKQLELNVENLCISIDDDTASISGEAPDQATKEKIILLVGNSEGIATVDDTMTVAEAEDVVPEAKFHTVVSGDTLGKIAKEYYGNAMKYPEIFEANKPMLTHPDKIYVGQVLRIPLGS